MAVTNLQEEEDAGEVAELEEEWLAAGPQAPEPILDPRPCKWVTNRGAVASDPMPAAKRAKEIAS